jgi:hypothetical protein
VRVRRDGVVEIYLRRSSLCFLLGWDGIGCTCVFNAFCFDLFGSRSRLGIQILRLSRFQVQVCS